MIIKLLNTQYLTISFEIEVNEWQNIYRTAKRQFWFGWITHYSPLREWIIPWLKKVIRVIGVLRTVVQCDRRFHNLCRSHLQSQVIVNNVQLRRDSESMRLLQAPRSLSENILVMAIYSCWCGNVLMQVNNLPLNYGWPNVYDSIDPIQLQTYFGQKAQEGLFS